MWESMTTDFCMKPRALDVDFSCRKKTYPNKYAPFSMLLVAYSVQHTILLFVGAEGEDGIALVDITIW